jgi:SPOR domain
MADDKFRSSRSRDPLADIDPLAGGAMSDPLAELARLIGQSDPVVGPATRQSSSVSLGRAPSADAGWSHDDSYAQPDQYAESRNEQPRFGDPYPEARSHPPQQRDYPQQPAARYSAQPADFDYAQDDATAADAGYRNEVQPVAAGRQLPVPAPQPSNTGYSDAGYDEAAEQWQDGADPQAYAPEDYDDEVPSGVRRSGTVVVLAVLGLATVGIAGAFAYRTMFGGSVLPSLPPIIKANDGPNKIIPSQSASQADAASQAGATNGAGEKLVSREEKPLTMQPPPGAAPRVISTIPVLPGPDAAFQGAPPYVAPTSTAPPAAPGAALPGATAPQALSAQSSAPTSTAPKKIHTVIIRPDQSGSAVEVAPPAGAATNAGTAAPTASAPLARSAPRPLVTSAPRPAATPAAPRPAVNAPLAIVPQQEEASAPPPQQQPMAPPPTRLARVDNSNAPLALGPAASSSAPPFAAPSPVSAGGYAVQVTSQRSQQEATAAFRSLQAKFPDQLGGHAPIIRRADLGDKGTFYRALVGPFASAEQAAAMCSNLKSAGGTCIVQRN